MYFSNDNYKKNNSISLIKLLAAFQVMLCHLIEHLNLSFPDMAKKALSFYRGVPIFFIISGYLIWLSVERSTSYSTYIKKRFWRIYPELWGAIAIEILSIVILYSVHNIRYLLAFAITQGTILQFWTPDFLRGYGCGTPNGTLWTICVMIQFYIVVWIIFKLLHKKNFYIWIVSLLSLVGVSIVGQLYFEKIGVEVLTKLYDHTIVRYAWLFCFGCFIAEYKKTIVDIFLLKYWYFFLILATVPYLTHFDIIAGYYVIHSCLLVLGLIGFAYAFPKLSIKTDISYGIFLYHMIIANIFLNYGLMEKWIFVVLIMAISVALAYVSNITIGIWSTKKKKY